LLFEASADHYGTSLTGSKTAGADTGTSKTEVIIPVRAIIGGLHHQMIKQIVLHRFYVYPSPGGFAVRYTLLTGSCTTRGSRYYFTVVVHLLHTLLPHHRLLISAHFRLFQLPAFHPVSEPVVKVIVLHTPVTELRIVAGA
jgi:hypothetical protein